MSAFSTAPASERSVRLVLIFAGCLALSSLFALGASESDGLETSKSLDSADSALMNRLELRSLVAIGGTTYASIHDPVDQATIWAQQGGEFLGIKLVEISEANEAITVSQGKRQRVIRLGSAAAQNDADPFNAQIFTDADSSFEVTARTDNGKPSELNRVSSKGKFQNKTRISYGPDSRVAFLEVRSSIDDAPIGRETYTYLASGLVKSSIREAPDGIVVRSEFNYGPDNELLKIVITGPDGRQQQSKQPRTYLPLDLLNLLNQSANESQAFDQPSAARESKR